MQLEHTHIYARTAPLIPPPPAPAACTYSWVGGYNRPRYHPRTPWWLLLFFSLFAFGRVSAVPPHLTARMKSNSSLPTALQQSSGLLLHLHLHHNFLDNRHPPRPLHLLAECSLAVASRSQLSSTLSQTQTRHIPELVHQSHSQNPSLTEGSRGKRKLSQIMNANRPDDDFHLPELHHHQQQQQLQHLLLLQQQQQQQKNQQQGQSLTLGNILSQSPPSAPHQSSSSVSLGKDIGLDSLICAAQSTPCPIQDPPPASSSKGSQPLPPLIPKSSSSVCSSAASCCDVDDCTSKCPSECDDEDCTEPCEDCIDTPCDLNTTCQIVPILCSEKTCPGPTAPCPEDETCVQEIVCQKDGCEVTSYYPPLDHSGHMLNGHMQSFVDPPPSWGGLQTYHGGVEPNLLDLSYSNGTQGLNGQLHPIGYPQQQLFNFSNQQQLNNHIQVIAISEPSQSSSRSSSAFLEPYDSFSSASPFDHGYSTSSKRRRVSSTTPLTSPSFEPYTSAPSKPSTPFSEPLTQWPTYSSPPDVPAPWNGNDLLDTNNLLNTNTCLNSANLFSDTNLLELGDCHWDGCNAHLATDEDLQLHLSTHLDPSLEQCLWDACGLEVHGIDELKSHLQHEHLVSTRKCEWEGDTEAACGRVFSSAEELQKHVKETHIAVLKKKTGYYCCWAGCGRRERGFSQKGKVERHMQTHTGCRVSLCDEYLFL